MSDGLPTTGPTGNKIDPTGHSAPVASETLYGGLAGYGFARRYVQGKVVANVAREGLGYGSHLLSEAAGQVVGLTDSAEAAELAACSHPAPNAEYRGMEFPAIPYSEDHFDVVVALEELGPPEGLVDEAKRVLKPDGVLIVSTPDRRALLEAGPEGEGRRRGMYAPEFREFLGRHFGSVRLFRRGAVAGGIVFPEDGETTGVSVESALASATLPSVGPEPPATRSVLAVCFRTGAPEGGDPAELRGPYLLLDRDRRVFDEGEDLTADVELLREEIGRMEETEVQAFQDSYRLLFSEIAVLRAQVRSSQARTRQIQAQVARSERRAEAAENRIREMENSTTWRVFEPYRQLRTRLDETRKGTQDR